MGNYLRKMPPKFSKEEFRRKAWVSMARDDVPLDVFDLDSSEVTEEFHRVLVSNATYRSSWNAEIGNDRQESYLDFETYYEQIPYTDYENKYNTTTKTYDRVPVTKYRKEERQRQVTKYRTVTDWHTGNGSHAGKVRFFDSVDDGFFDSTRFFQDYRSEELVELSPEEQSQHPEMKISQEMLKRAVSVQTLQIEVETKGEAAKTGDHIKGFSYTVDELQNTGNVLIRVPEYKTTIEYNGKTYQKKAFPFGKMTVSKVGIQNPLSAASEKKRLLEQTDRENEKRNKEIEPKIWKQTQIFNFASLGLLAASILCSLFINVLFLVIAFFVGAVGMTAYAIVQAKRVRRQIEKETKDVNDEAIAAWRKTANEYEKNRKEALLAALNKKLTSLGLEPAEMSELD